MARNGIKINSWDGGLNSKVSPEQGLLNESPQLRNVDFDDIGAVQTRKGREYFDNIGSGEVGILKGITFDSYGSQLFGVCDSSAYVTSSDASNTMSLVVNGAGAFTDNAQVFGVEQSNYLFLSDGNNMRKYDGTVLTNWGIQTQPLRLPVGVHYAGPETSYPGDATYVLTYEDIFGTETLASTPRYTGDPSPSAGDMGCQFTFTNPTAIDGVEYLNVYRKLPSQDLYYRLTSQSYTGAVDATIIDDYSSDLLSNPTYGVVVDPTAQDDWDVFVSHLGYMFASGSTNPTWLYYSDINKPSSFPADQLIRVGDGDGIQIRCLGVLGTGLLIGKDNGFGEGSIWYLYTPNADPLNWSVAQIKTGYGSIAKKAIPRFSRFRMLLNQEGIYDLEETEVGNVQSNPLSFNIEPNIRALANSSLHKSVAVQYQNKVYISVPGSGSATNDSMYVYDYVRGRQEVSKLSGAWSQWDNCTYSDLAVFKGDLFGSGYDGNVYKMNQNYVDYDGTSVSGIDSYIRTMSIYGIPEHSDNMKVWRRAWITLETPGAWTVGITYAEDLYSSTGSTKTVDVSPNASFWGVAAWGTSTWGRETQRKVFRVDFDNQVSKKIQLKFSTSDASSHFKLYDVMLEYNLRGIR